MTRDNAQERPQTHGYLLTHELDGIAYHHVGENTFVNDRHAAIVYENLPTTLARILCATITPA